MLAHLGIISTMKGAYTSDTEVLVGLPHRHLKTDWRLRQERTDSCAMNNGTPDPQCRQNTVWHTSNSQDMMKETIQQMRTDKNDNHDICSISHSMLNFLIGTSGKEVIYLTKKGDAFDIQMDPTQMKVLELGCMVMAQGRDLVLVMGGAPWYSRLKQSPRQQ